MRQNWLSSVFSIMGFLLFWELAVRLLEVSQFLLPPPSSIAVYLFANSKVFWSNSAITFVPIVGATILSVCAGVIAGLLTADSKWLGRIFEPVFLFFEMIPKIAFAPILITWLGFGIESRLFMGTLIGFFPVYASSYAAFSRRSDVVDMHMTAWNAKYLSFLVRIRVPYAFPRIIGGIQTSVLFALIGVVVLEFIASGKGIGYLVVERWGRSDTVGAFAAIMVLFLFGSALYVAVTALSNAALHKMNLEKEI